MIWSDLVLLYDVLSSISHSNTPTIISNSECKELVLPRRRRLEISAPKWKPWRRAWHYRTRLLKLGVSFVNNVIKKQCTFLHLPSRTITSKDFRMQNFTKRPCAENSSRFANYKGLGRQNYWYKVRRSPFRWLLRYIYITHMHYFDGLKTMDG